jgi:hypothetical protein
MMKTSNLRGQRVAGRTIARSSRRQYRRRGFAEGLLKMGPAAVLTSVKSGWTNRTKP